MALYAASGVWRCGFEGQERVAWLLGAVSMEMVIGALGGCLRDGAWMRQKQGPGLSPTQGASFPKDRPTGQPKTVTREEENHRRWTTWSQRKKEGAMNWTFVPPQIHMLKP